MSGNQTKTLRCRSMGQGYSQIHARPGKAGRSGVAGLSSAAKGGENQAPNWAGRFAELDPGRILHRIVRNPNYSGQSLSLNSWKAADIIPGYQAKPDFYRSLVSHIQSDGVRNPIIVYCLPEGWLLSFGGSRLAACRELGRLVPALVVDYTGEFRHDIRVDESNWQDFFTDVPKYFEWTDYGIDTHFGLEKNREHDPAGLQWDPEGEWIAKEMPWIKEPK